jgi:uncharacterized OB-fold protein
MSPTNVTQVRVLRCDACGALDPGPREVCPHCFQRGLEEIGVPGFGHLLSWTMVRRAPTRFRGEAPYAVAVVQLDAGVRIIGRLEHATDDIAPGARVVASGAGPGYAIFRCVP